MLFSVGTALTLPIFIIDVANSTNSINKPLNEFSGVPGTKTGNSPLVKDVLGSAIIKTGVYCTSFAMFPRATVIGGFAYIILYSGLFDNYDIHSLISSAGAGAGVSPASPASPPVSKIADKLR
jgi:hypothetical protein